MAVENNKALRDLVVAVQGLAVAGGAENGRIGLREVAHTIRMAAPFVSCFGLLAQLAIAELKSKAKKFEEACASVPTIEHLIEGDVEAGKERKRDSLSRYLIRMKRGLQFASFFFTHLLASRGESIAVPLQTAYNQVFGTLHGRSLRETIYACTHLAPNKSNLLRNFGEDEQSAQVLMEEYIIATNFVVTYTDGLFSATEQGRELLKMI